MLLCCVLQCGECCYIVFCSVVSVVMLSFAVWLVLLCCVLQCGECCYVVFCGVVSVAVLCFAVW